MIGFQHVGDGDHHIEGAAVVTAAGDGGALQSRAQLQEIQFLQPVALLKGRKGVVLLEGWKRERVGLFLLARWGFRQECVQLSIGSRVGINGRSDRKKASKGKGVRPRRVPTSSAGVAERGIRYPKSPSQPAQSLLVQVYAWRGLMAVSRIRSTTVAASSDCEAWSHLDEGVLRPSRSRQVCMTCHWFRHHASASCITLLCCQLHQGLIGQGEHLNRRCHAWSEAQALRQGWAPEVG